MRKDVAPGDGADLTESGAPFVEFWRRAIRDADMPVARKGFACILATWANTDGTSCYPSISTLVGVGYSKRTVHYHLRELEADGWLYVAHGGGRLPDGSYDHNRYVLRVPELAGADVAPLEGERCNLGPGAGAEVALQRCNESTTTVSPTVSETVSVSTLSELFETVLAAGLDPDEVAESAIRINGFTWSALDEEQGDAELVLAYLERVEKAA